MKKVALFVLVVAAAGSLGRTAPAETAPASLADFFKPGAALQDRNGDGAIDFIDARIIMPEQPASAELAAASNVAARLGYETSAMNIPVDVARSLQPGASHGWARLSFVRLACAPTQINFETAINLTLTFIAHLELSDFRNLLHRDCASDEKSPNNFNLRRRLRRYNRFLFCEFVHPTAAGSRCPETAG